ncbi:YkuS family protein [Pseudalkalibacillus caeni]|uniref:Gas vesicle protein n=1 Tax=Exobacillus caeni TaxID=2574798 RepID=A0A5R9F8P5_9BACL|nr:YkuS family protein [Pseudalkalibacillus caeni]TLS36085.1 hypothetical protein FCL54_17000 [Pseudalkalibacillus caeni]
MAKVAVEEPLTDVHQQLLEKGFKAKMFRNEEKLKKVDCCVVRGKEDLLDDRNLKNTPIVEARGRSVHEIVSEVQQHIDRQQSGKDYGKKQAAKGLTTGLVTGTVIGATAGLLFAPKSGKEMRKDIADVSKQAKEKTTEVASTVKEKSSSMKNTVSEKTQDAKEKVNKAKDKVTEAGSKVSEKLKSKSSGSESNTQGTGLKVAVEQPLTDVKQELENKGYEVEMFRNEEDINMDFDCCVARGKEDLSDNTLNGMPVVEARGLSVNDIVKEVQDHLDRQRA